MKRIAVVGGGIAGLGAAYVLSRRHEVHLFEKAPRLGGHTHTIAVDGADGPLALDTGFLVHNDRTYPNLVRLFAELGVETQPSDMSFGVTCRRTGYEYSSRGVAGFFADPRNLVRPRHYRLLAEIVRFNREAPAVLADPEGAATTLGEFVERRRFTDDFLRYYLYPMASAVWSASTHAIRSFPAPTLVRFFDNHGMLGLDTHPRWKVVRGGSHRYLDPITAPYRDRVRTNAGIRSIARLDRGVELRFAHAPAERFDEVVLACHGDQVLGLLADPSHAEREVFGRFETTRNDVWLHTDPAMLPRRAAARASWNYNLDGDDARGATVTYHLNRLQSLNPPGGAIDPARVLARLVYHHPSYTAATLAAQARWAEVSGLRHTHYCGAYWRYGFHEDGFVSALRVAGALGVDWSRDHGTGDLHRGAAASAASPAAA
jgi:predicted NAD/FAD-binding protein